MMIRAVPHCAGITAGTGAPDDAYVELSTKQLVGIKF